MDAERSVTSRRSRLLVAALSAGALAVGSLWIAAATSATTSTDGEDDYRLMSVSAPGANKTAVPVEPPADMTDVVTALASGPGCDDGKACMWHQNGYEGEKQFAHGWMDSYGWLYYTGYTFNSTKNRFGNRKFVVAASSGQILSCLDPNENRPNLDPAAKYFNVGGLGSRCGGGGTPV